MPRTDSASRVIAAPPERVYAAFVDPDALVAWLAPTGMSGRFTTFDPRPGGGYRLELSYGAITEPRGKTTPDSDVVVARFVELVPGEWVVQEIDFMSDDPAFDGTMTMTWKVTAVEDGTRIDIVATDVPSGISEEDHAAGLAAALANLAGLLETSDPT